MKNAKCIDLSCFSNAKVWFLYGMSEKQVKNWIKRKFKLDVKELVEDTYSGITVSITNLEWVVYVPSTESSSSVDLLKAVVHEAVHVALQLAKSNSIQDEETVCLVVDYLTGKIASIVGII